MAAVRVRLDRAGIRQILTSGPVRAMVDGAAARTAGHIHAQARQVRSPGWHGGGLLPHQVQVVPSVGWDGRPIAQVTLAHPAGMGMQAKYGVVTRAVHALGAGVDVTERDR